MKLGEKLIWELFLKLKEVLPATADNTKWANEWAIGFHAMAAPPPADAAPDDPGEPDELEDPEPEPHDEEAAAPRHRPPRGKRR